MAELQGKQTGPVCLRCDWYLSQLSGAHTVAAF